MTETVGMSGKEATTIVKPVRNINFVGGLDILLTP